MRRSGASRRGFALADFLTGTAIFAGALVAFAGLTRSKFTVLHEAGALQIGQSHLEAELDRLRREGLPAAPAGQADARGFQPVARRTVGLRGLGSATETVSARPLVILAGEQRRVEADLLEVRVELRWTEGALSLSAVLPRRRAQ